MVPRLKEHSTAMAPAGCAAMGRGPGTATPRRVALGALGGLAHRRRRPGEPTGRQIPLVPDRAIPYLLEASHARYWQLVKEEGSRARSACSGTAKIEDANRSPAAAKTSTLDN